MGLSAAGVWAVQMGQDDAVVGGGVVRDDAWVTLVTDQGYAKRIAIKNFPRQKRYGGGVQAAKLSARTGPVAVAALVGEGQDVVLVTAKGRTTKLPSSALPLQGRATSGSQKRADTREPYFDPAKHGAPVLLTVLAGRKAAPQRKTAARSKAATGSASAKTRKRKAARSVPQSKSRRSEK